MQVICGLKHMSRSLAVEWKGTTKCGYVGGLASPMAPVDYASFIPKRFHTFEKSDSNYIPEKDMRFHYFIFHEHTIPIS